jgi:hypothetical protein
MHKNVLPLSALERPTLCRSLRNLVTVLAELADVYRNRCDDMMSLFKITVVKYHTDMACVLISSLKLEYLLSNTENKIVSELHVSSKKYF